MMIFVFGFVLFGCGDNESSANKIFVQASSAIAESETAELASFKYTLLKKADDAVREIKNKYSETNVAVRIASGEKIGSLTQAELGEALYEAGLHSSVCFNTSDKICRFRPIVDTMLCRELSVAETFGTLALTSSPAELERFVTQVINSQKCGQVGPSNKFIGKREGNLLSLQLNPSTPKVFGVARYFVIGD